MCLDVSKQGEQSPQVSLHPAMQTQPQEIWAQTYLENSSCVRAVMEWRGWDGAGFLSQLISYGYCGRQALQGLWAKNGWQHHCCCPYISSLKRYEDGDLWLFANFLQLHLCTFTPDLGNLLFLILPFVISCPLAFPLTLTRDLWGCWGAPPHLLSVRR